MTNGNGSGHMIKFGDGFNERPQKEQLEYLKKLASSQNYALDMMQKDRDALAAELVKIKAELANMEAAMNIQKEIVMANITQSNQETQERIVEIQALKSKIRELGR